VTVFERRKKRWSELTRVQQRSIVAGGAAQVVLQVAALWDLHRRSDAELRGSRRWWTAASFLNFVGPIAYFVAGRRNPRR
jgi:Phospholipase_D-nuclease N-terminal